MLPIPSRTAALAFAGCAGMLAVGLLARVPAVVTLAAMAMLGIIAAAGATLMLPARLRRQRLELAWRISHEGNALVRGSAFAVRCRLRHGGRTPLIADDVAAVASDFVASADEPPRSIRIEPGTDGDFELDFTARACGRAVLHGLALSVRGPAGLFSAPLYFASPLTVRILPRAAAQAALAFDWSLSTDMSGARPTRRAGTGTEIAELREHRPGDALKLIAWRASAKAGRLMVREMEHEAQATLSIIVDVGPSMRGDRPGWRPLDRAIDVAALSARGALEQGDRAGLLTVDTKILRQVAARDGVAHAARIYEALLSASEATSTDDDAPDARARSEGLALALREAAGRQRAPRTVLVISDLENIDLDALDATLRVLRARSHDIVFVVPETAALASPPTSELEAELRDVFARAAKRRINSARAALARHAIPLLPLGPAEFDAATVARARRAAA
jgi:uncharacterized protein (DUF58 family)